MWSQESAASTVPYEYEWSQHDDEEFEDELNSVHNLYFQNHPNDENFFGSYDESYDPNPAMSDHNESDMDSDAENLELEATTSTVILEDLSEIDQNELQKQERFMTESCGCKEFYSGKPCSQVLDHQSILDFRGFCQELSHDELDIAVKSALLCHRNSGQKTSSKSHKPLDRCRPSQQYFYMGNRICRTMFCFLYSIDRQKLQVLGKSLDCDGLKPRTHGLTNRLPPNSLTFTERQNILTFVLKYASINAVPLPGRLPNQRNCQVLLLPSDKTKSDIHLLYQQTAIDMGMRTVSLRTFLRLWKELCPNIVMSKPQTDLCHKCQTFSSKISHSGALEEDDKSALLQSYESHINFVKMERDAYREQCAASKESYINSPSAEGAYCFDFKHPYKQFMFMLSVLVDLLDNVVLNVQTKLLYLVSFSMHHILIQEELGLDEVHGLLK